MISTTMHLAPGAPIMKSYDLVSWEIVGYVYDRLGVGDVSSLRNGKNGYGNGQWASSLRYRDGTFYVVFNTNDLGVVPLPHGRRRARRVGAHRARPGFHDPSLFFDEADGGTPYIFYGSGATSAVRLNDDLTAIEADFPNIFRAADYAGEPFVGGCSRARRSTTSTASTTSRSSRGPAARTGRRCSSARRTSSGATRPPTARTRTRRAAR